ncbi:hypothetical protein IL306_005896, partial [Fusarium sp. DS 682]
QLTAGLRSEKSNASKKSGRRKKRKSRNNEKKRRGCTVNNSSGKQLKKLAVNARKRSAKNASGENARIVRIWNANEQHAKLNSDDSERSKNASALKNCLLSYDGSTHAQTPSSLSLPRNSSGSKAADTIQFDVKPTAQPRVVSSGCSTPMQLYFLARRTLTYPG